MKVKKRGFVMTGGGAKGFYEAGVIHAFHITGMEFDVITGSSIGAMNSIIYAEYLYRKAQLAEAVRQDPLQAIEALDPFIRAYLRTWLLMPHLKIIDDSTDGPIGKLKDDLARFNVSLPQLVELGWWYRDPDRASLPAPTLWPSLLKLMLSLVERVGGGSELLRLLKEHPDGLVSTALRVYLTRFGMDKSLVPADDTGLHAAFTATLTPLLPEHLDADVTAEYDPVASLVKLIDPQRTLGDYAAQHIDLRLTRANYRTGRLEISTHLSPEDFIRFMHKQAWRVDVPDPTRIPLGSFRLQMPGNPNAVNAALASGRFPAVFAPYPLQHIYPETDPENKLLYQLVDGWLGNQEAEARLAQAYENVKTQGGQLETWPALLASWQKSARMHGFFPLRSDIYVDGGSIDNTPANSAVDAVREWTESTNWPRRDTVLELFVIYLYPEPGVNPAGTANPAIFQVVGRTLEIQGAAVKSSEGVTVDTINTFGQRAEDLGRALQALLASHRDLLSRLPEADQAAANKNLTDSIAQLGLDLPPRGPNDDILNQLAVWAAQMIGDKLPLPVSKVIVYPDEMPLDTLEFTERLGYTKDNGIKMVVQGCHNTLFALRNHLEQPENILDDQDRRALALARQWMGGQPWPPDTREQLRMRGAWQCTRTACVFHTHHCPRGLSSQTTQSAALSGREKR
jgi:hypothetical protein